MPSSGGGETGARRFLVSASSISRIQAKTGTKKKSDRPQKNEDPPPLGLRHPTTGPEVGTHTGHRGIATPASARGAAHPGLRRPANHLHLGTTRRCPRGARAPPSLGSLCVTHHARATGPIYLFCIHCFFPHPKVETFTQILFIQPNVPQRRWSFLRGYVLLCDISCLSRSKMAIFMHYALLCDIFYLRGPQRRKKKQHFYVNFLLYSLIF